MRSATNLVFCIAFLSVSAAAQGNWVHWVDETGARLTLSTVTVGDNQEKDLVAGDIDKDGDRDVLIVRKVPFSNAGSRTNVLLMNENGVLVERTAQLMPGFMTADDSRDVLLFDADGDTWLDVVVCNTFSGDPRLYINQGNNGAGVWQGYVESTNWFSPAFPVGPKFCAVYEGDVDGDADLDLYFSDYDNPLEDRLLINDGSGQFTDETSTRFPTGLNSSLFGTGSFMCDFTQDGWVDILQVSGMFQPLRLLINDGTGVFMQVQTLPSQSVYMARVDDFDNDGFSDIYVVSDQQDYTLHYDSTNANETINVTQTFVTNSNKTGGFGGNVHQADLDRDGFLDVGVADVNVDIPGCSRRFAALQNTMPARGMTDPNGSLNLGWNRQGVHDFAFVDLNMDGFWDMIQATCTGYAVWMMEPFAAGWTFGAGCPTMLQDPRIGINGVPQLGTTYDITLSGALPTAPALVLIGSNPSTATLGDCEVLVAQTGLFTGFFVLTSGTGTGTFPIAIPNNTNFIGFELFQQWLITDPMGTVDIGGGLLWTLSDGLRCHIDQ